MSKFWEFKNKKDQPDVGELMLYGDISSASWWGDEVTPQTFKKEMDALGDISTMNIYINSGGGDVFAGQAIYSMLKRKKCAKNVYIDGLAASIASVIAMAGDKIVMPENAMMMVHKCWTITAGNADDLRKMADDMDKIDESIISTYVSKTGKSESEILDIMAAETWMTAKEAVEMGFADELEEEKQIAASIHGWEARYKNTPEKLKGLSDADPDPEHDQDEQNKNQDENRAEPETLEPVSDKLLEQKQRFMALKLKILGGYEKC